MFIESGGEYPPECDVEDVRDEDDLRGLSLVLLQLIVSVADPYMIRHLTVVREEIEADLRREEVEVTDDVKALVPAGPCRATRWASYVWVFDDWNQRQAWEVARHTLVGDEVDKAEVMQNICKARYSYEELGVGQYGGE